jgi:two-component system NarL family sensor kinase
MGPEAGQRERLLRWLFAGLALLVPLLVADYVYLQWWTAVPEFTFLWHQEGQEPSVVHRVIPGGGAEAAGLRPGDVVVTEDGAPFPGKQPLRVGQTVALGIERDGQRLELDVPLVPMIQLRSAQLMVVVILSLVIWGGSVLLLWRCFRRAEVRLLFLLAQAAAIFALYPPVELTAWCRGLPWLQVYLSGTSVFLFPALLLHFHLTFPVVLGTPLQRRRALILIYGAALVSATLWAAAGAGWLIYGDLGWQALGLLLVLEFLAVIVLLVYVYLRRATPDGRRRLRLIVFGTSLAVGCFALLFVLPAVLTAASWIPTWLAALFLLLAPLSYFYATARHNLFGIDRLLNRTLVYGLLSVGVLVVYVASLLLLYRLAPDEPLPQAMALAVLTLLVGLSLNWARAQIQRLVDRLFYGGWYDYPGVVETVSNALARSLTREQLDDVLTRQVPRLMQLRPGHLWIEGMSHVPEPEATLPKLQFPLSFQDEVQGLWTVGPRLDGEDLAPADRRILQTVARQAQIALSNVLLVETLRGQLDQIREAQHQLLRSREEERAHLARELHDGPIQALVGLNLQLGLLLASQPLATAETELPAMRAEVRQLLAELRLVCAQLRPPMLDTVGLGAALRALTSDWSDQNSVAVRVELPPDTDLRPLPDEVAVNLYRVVQELLTNVARHAAAGQVSLHLACEDGRLSLTLADDGRGFLVPESLQSLAAQNHFGLAGIQERVNLIGGRLVLDSAPGRGTRAHVTWQAVTPP